MNLSTTLAKDIAAKAASDLIQEGMIVGLGTGSTAALFIDHLIERCKTGLHIRAVATSQHSFDQASKGGIPMADVNQLVKVDMTVDGADEVDGQKRLIKGGGGALLREKIVASMSDEMVVIVDEHKLVEKLGQHALPVEIVPFAHISTVHKLELLGYKGAERRKADGDLFVTENGNYVVDIDLKSVRQTPELIDKEIRSVPGVVETGFFFNLAGRVIVGYNDGSYRMIS